MPNQETSMFEQSYNRLNAQQKQAVDQFATQGGPIMVMAGPGTGKTQVLATTVAQILKKQDILPQNILALTFTDAASQNMRDRIVKLIGTEGFYVNIMTFHAFASEVIATYPEKFPIEKSSEPLSEYERFEIFEKILIDTKLTELKPLNIPLYYIKDVIRQISQLKREYVSSEKFENILNSEELQLKNSIEEYWQEQSAKAEVGKKAKTKLSAVLLKQEKNLKKQKELLTVYVEYQKELSKRKRYDFDDMISFVVQAFELDEELLLDYQERFQYILVDEYQDTNAAQNKIVELLANYWEESPNLFVVGDPHQSIFRFQGASTENMLSFIDRYPTCTVITLATGYRCSQQVYSAAHTLIKNNILNFRSVQMGKNQLNEFGTEQLNDALSVELQASQKDGEDVLVFPAESEGLQLFYLAEEIKKLVKTGVKYEDIAILYRNNTEASEIAEILEKWEIPYERSVGENVLDDFLVEQLLQFFLVMQNLGKGVYSDEFFTVLQYSWLGLNTLDIYKLSRIAGKLQVSIEELLEEEYETILTKTEQIYGLSREGFGNVVSFRNKVLEWYARSNNVLFHEWFSLVINSENSDEKNTKEAPKPAGFGFMQYVLEQPVKTEHLYAINSLYSEIKKFVAEKRNFNLEDFLNKISVMQEHSVKLKIEKLTIQKNRVTLSTAHSSKGKEWKYVFVYGVTDKKWGNSRDRELIPLPDSILTNTDVDKKEKNEDDRRLFYVALTRSSKKSYILWSQTNLSGKELSNSMFLNEIENHTRVEDEKVTQNLLQNSEQLLEKLLVTTDGMKTYSRDEKAFFEQLVGEFKLSVTALNNYLKDPHEFLVNSLLRIPRAKSPILAFGTATHFALEQFYKGVILGKNISKTQFISNFEYALQREQLTKQDFEERKKHGQKVLEFYYDTVLDPAQFKHIPPLFVEKFFGGKLNKAVLFDGDKEIQLSGRIDRIELIDKNLKTIKVVDYKTGTPKSENVINGQSGIDEYSDREKKLPETIRGRYQRQLVFYKLLAELDATFPYTVTQAEFDFVEPGGTHKDAHVVRRFVVTDEALSDLKKLIIEVMREIRALKFLAVE